MLKSIINKKPDVISGFLFSNHIIGFGELVTQDQVLPHSAYNQFVEMVRHFLVSSWNDLILWSVEAVLVGSNLATIITDPDVADLIYTELRRLV